MGEPDSDSDEFARVGSVKRARHSTGSTGGVPPFSHSAQTINMDDIKNLTIDEKLNILLDNMLQLNVMKLRTDNIEKYVYFNCATHEVLDQRLRLIEYKQIDIEA